VELKIESTGQWLWAEYDSMTVESENSNYILHVTGYHGNAGDAFNNYHSVNWQATGRQFSTPDVDNDPWPNGNCAAVVSSGGWWFGWCSSSRLTGHNAAWFSGPSEVPVSASRMMLRCGAG